MGYKNISISEDVYLRLKKAKRAGESFSEVISRLLGPDDDISELFGIISMTEEERTALFTELDEIWEEWKL
jgi:predicted CopG family antitoxin